MCRRYPAVSIASPPAPEPRRAGILQPLAPRDGVAREIDGVPVAADEHLHHRRVEQIGGVADRRGERRRFGGRGDRKSRHERLERPGLDERLVTLHVDHEIAVLAA